jgi:hypothetical protein
MGREIRKTADEYCRCPFRDHRIKFIEFVDYFIIHTKERDKCVEKARHVRLLGDYFVKILTHIFLYIFFSFECLINRVNEEKMYPRL